MHPCQVWSCFWALAQTYDCLCPLRWHHNGRDSVSNHQPHHCLLNRLFRRRSKKTSKLRVTGLCAGNSPGTGEFPAQMASYAENVSIWWRHHAMGAYHCFMSCYIFRSLYIFCTVCRIQAQRLKFFVLHTTRNKAFLILFYHRYTESGVSTSISEDKNDSHPKHIYRLFGKDLSDLFYFECWAKASKPAI